MMTKKEALKWFEALQEITGLEPLALLALPSDASSKEVEEAFDHDRASYLAYAHEILDKL